MLLKSVFLLNLCSAKPFLNCIIWATIHLVSSAWHQSPFKVHSVFQTIFLKQFLCLHLCYYSLFLCDGKRPHLLQPPTLLPPKQGQQEQVIQGSSHSEYLKIEQLFDLSGKSLLRFHYSHRKKVFLMFKGSFLYFVLFHSLLSFH